MARQGQRISPNVREEIRRAVERGDGIGDVAKRYGVNRSTVSAIVREGPSNPTPSAPSPAGGMPRPSVSKIGPDPAAPSRPSSGAPSSGSSSGTSSTPSPTPSPGPAAADPEALARAKAAGGNEPPPGGTPPPGPGAPPPVSDAEFVVGTVSALKRTAMEGCIHAGLFPDLPGIRSAGELSPMFAETLAANASLVAPKLRLMTNMGWASVLIVGGLDVLFTYLAVRGAVVHDLKRRGKWKEPDEEKPQPKAAPAGPDPRTVGGGNPNFDPPGPRFDPTAPPGEIPDPRKGP